MVLLTTVRCFCYLLLGPGGGFRVQGLGSNCLSNLGFSGFLGFWDVGYLGLGLSQNEGSSGPRGRICSMPGFRAEGFRVEGFGDSGF